MKSNLRRSRIAALAVVLGSLCAALPCRAADAPPKFLRYVDAPAGHARLETSVVTYTNNNGASVDLIGVVHIADPAYFATLNESFKGYDALLYEMVKPKGMAHVERGHRSGSWVSGLQLFMKNQLDLDFQLDDIDYDAPNFVHADLDAETFFAKQEERGESMLTLMVQSMLREMSKAGNDANAAGQASEPGIMDLLAALQAPDRARQLKLVLAKQFEQMDSALDAMGGPDGSVILDERNKHALDVLKQQLDAGKKHVGVFYGAGHLHGMEQILTKQMGFQQAGPPRWIVAWDLTDPRAGKPATRPIVADVDSSSTQPVTK